jgi:colanic acid biosynthesis glycosyl transferase WcaI
MGGERAHTPGMKAGAGPRGPKLVFVNRYFYPDESATSRLLSDLAFRLAALGVNVAVVTSRQLIDDPQAGLPAHEVVSGVSVHRVATATQGRARLAGRAIDYLSFHAAAGAKLLALLASGDVVVAKTDPPLISIVVSHIARWRRVHLINWLQDLFPEVAVVLGIRAIPGWVASLLAAARDRSLRRASMNIVLGERMRDRLLSRGVNEEQIRIVTNWADPEQITPLWTEQSTTRQRLGLGGRFVVGYSGNLGRAHEFDTLLGAARLLRDDTRFAFLITGGGAKAAALRCAAEAQGLGNIYFLPHQPPELLADSLAAADAHLISLLPALEGLIVPSKLYGILAARRPGIFIGDTDGEVARVLRTHNCGISVSVGNSDGLAAELRSLRDDPQRVQELGQHGYTLASNRYTTDTAVQAWTGILADIAPDLVSGTRSPDVKQTQQSRTMITCYARFRPDSDPQ